MPFWSLPFSLFMAGAYLPTSRPAPVLGPMGQTANFTGTWPHTPVGWHQPQPPSSQPPQDIPSPTSSPAPAPGPNEPCSQTPRMQSYPPEGWHQPQDPQALQPATMGPGPAHQWASSHHMRQDLAPTWTRGQPNLTAYSQQLAPSQ